MRYRWKRFTAICMAGIIMFSSAGEMALPVEASEAGEPLLVEEINALEETEVVQVITENMVMTQEDESVLAEAVTEETEPTEDETEAVTEDGTIADNYCGNTVTWTLEDGVLTISGTGEMFDYTKVSETPWYANASEITSVVIEDGVTTVAAYGFREFTALENVVIGNDVTTIGKYAFYKCTSLSQMVFGDGVTEIGAYAFYNCTSITEAVIPDSVTYLGYSSFSGASGLKSVLLGEGLEIIENAAFENCTGLETVVLGSNVTYIDKSAFSDDSAIQTITIPNQKCTCREWSFDNVAPTKILIRKDAQSVALQFLRFESVTDF